MGKWIKRLVVLAVLAVFLFSVGRLAYKAWEDREGKKNYAAAAERFTGAAAPAEAGAAGDGTGDAAADTAPISVDFDALHAANEDVVAWIYCEGTPVNYPVLHGDDNDQYLRHLYDGSYNTAGSIFLDANNMPDFSDTNTIIYGHNMNNGSMFGTLAQWQDQAYYQEHPCFWLLTPAQDYRVDLLGGYYTSAYSDVYTIYRGHGEEFDVYMAGCLAQSAFTADAAYDGNANYVLLSTCADSELVNEERFVMHGKLVPVAHAESAP